MPREMITGSPSRKVFPRGFLWDDGFHLQVICKVNKKKCYKIADSWLESMDIFGYISRE
jgi:mannosyl-oligosaccharide glucosidase